MVEHDRWSAIFWFFFSIFVAYESYKLGLGQVNQPGPGFLFFWTAIFIGILSLVIIVKTFSKIVSISNQTNKLKQEKSNKARVILVIVSLFLYGIFMERLGFIIVTFLLFIFLLGFIEKKSWWYVECHNCSPLISAF